MPGHAQFGGDSRDGGGVDHQPPQHIPGTPAGWGFNSCKRTRDREAPQALISNDSTYGPQQLTDLGWRGSVYGENRDRAL